MWSACMLHQMATYAGNAEGTSSTQAGSRWEQWDHSVPLQWQKLFSIWNKTDTRYFESQKAEGRGNDSSTIVVCSMFNYCWWKGHFVGPTSESRISESDFLVLGCLTKSACNPLENFTVLAFSLTVGSPLSWRWHTEQGGGQKKRCARDQRKLRRVTVLFFNIFMFGWIMQHELKSQFPVCFVTHCSCSL